MSGLGVCAWSGGVCVSGLGEVCLVRGVCVWSGGWCAWSEGSGVSGLGGVSDPGGVPGLGGCVCLVGGGLPQCLVGYHHPPCEQNDKQV